MNKKMYMRYEIMHSVINDSGQLFFLDAPGGTGKTFLINLLLASIRSKKYIAIAVASSGIAATLIEGGKTANSAFKLPFNLNHANALCNISKQSDMAQVLRDAKIIIWDLLYGGVTMLLAGDFRQTLPVVPRGTRVDEVRACLKSSFLWPHIKILSLKTNMRVQSQNNLKAFEFSKLLLDVGNGNIPEKDGKIQIPKSLCQVVTDLVSLVDKIYANIRYVGVNCSAWLKERAILTPTNEAANN